MPINAHKSVRFWVYLALLMELQLRKKAFLNMLTRVLKNYEKLNLINFIHKNTKIIKLFCKLLFQHLKYCFLLQGSFAPQITMPNGHYELLSSVLAKKNYPI